MLVVGIFADEWDDTGTAEQLETWQLAGSTGPHDEG